MCFCTRDGSDTPINRQCKMRSQNSLVQNTQPIKVPKIEAITSEEVSKCLESIITTHLDTILWFLFSSFPFLLMFWIYFVSRRLKFIQNEMRDPCGWAWNSTWEWNSRKRTERARWNSKSVAARCWKEKDSRYLVENRQPAYALFRRLFGHECR